MAKLFMEYTLKDLKLKNRIVMAPMCQYSTDDSGHVQDWHFVHYGTRAVGGVGLIIVEATAVEPRGRITAQDLGIWDDQHVMGLSKLVDVCHDQGAKIGIQIAHAGRKCTSPMDTIVAPSPIPFNSDSRTPVELTVEEIQKIINAFGNAAQRALEAGFDLIEIHGAHGYLISEFLSPLSNHRTDAYGGSPENRVRFLREIIQKIRRVWPSHKPLAVRVSAEDYDPTGIHPEEMAILINLSQKDGIDLINVSSGAVIPAQINVYPGYQVAYSEVIRKQCQIPTIAGGLITSPLMAEEILQNNRADLVYLGRELLRNPYWPLEAANALGTHISWPKQYERSK